MSIAHLRSARTRVANCERFEFMPIKIEGERKLPPSIIHVQFVHGHIVTGASARGLLPVYHDDFVILNVGNLEGEIAVGGLRRNTRVGYSEFHV